MPTISQTESWKTYTTKISSALEITAYILCFTTMIVALFDNNLSMKLYTGITILSVLALSMRGKPTLYSLRYWILPLSILALGSVDVIWYSTFKMDDSPFRGTYHSYLNAAKIFIFGAFITFMALTTKIRLKKEFPLYILYSLSFIIAGIAYYVKSTTGIDRLNFGIGTATGAAYSIILVGIVSAISILYTKRNHPFLFLLNALAVLYALGLTQTRSALLIFPILCTLALIACYIKSPKTLFFSVIGFFTLLALIIVAFSKPIYNRYHEGVKDLTKYSTGNSDSSLGARLAMYEVGAIIFANAPLSARSADERYRKMRSLANERPYLRTALRFSKVHLHNEFIEAASLKGIAGIFSTLFFYTALLFTVYYHRSLGLFMITLAIIGTGLSDVILWSRSIPIVLMTAMVILIFIKRKKVIEDQPQ